MALGTRLQMEAPVVEPLPARLRDVLEGLVRGEAEKQIARRLGLSPNTVNRHVQRLYRRLEVRSRGELMFLLAQKERARLEPNLALDRRD